MKMALFESKSKLYQALLCQLPKRTNKSIIFPPKTLMVKFWKTKAFLEGQTVPCPN